MKKERVLVIGMGNFGSGVARALHSQGHEVIAIDKHPDLVDRFADDATRAVLGDGTDPALLERIGAKSADAAVISTGGDLAASVLATLALKDLGLDNIYVKVNSRSAARVLKALNVHETIFPEQDVALRLAHRITSKTVLEHVPLGENHSIEEIAIPDPWLGKTLRDLALPRTHGIQVVAIYDVLSGELNVVPDPDRPLRDSDVAIVVGEDAKLTELVSRASRHR